MPAMTVADFARPVEARVAAAGGLTGAEWVRILKSFAFLPLERQRGMFRSAALDVVDGRLVVSRAWVHE